MVNNTLILYGVGLMGLGFAPTPDDVTIISPLIQISAGAVLTVLGLFGGNDGK